MLSIWYSCLFLHCANVYSAFNRLRRRTLFKEAHFSADLLPVTPRCASRGSTRLAFILVALALVSAGDGAVTPTTSALLSLASPREAQGETLGFAQGIASIGRIVGPLAAGSMFSLVGPGAPFLMGSVLTILALLIALPTMPESRRLRATEVIAIEKGEVEEMETTSIARELYS